MSASGLSSRAIIGSFYHALEQNDGASWVNPLAKLFFSDQESEDYKFLDAAPTMREWVDGRMAASLFDNSITIANKLYEATLEIPVDWIRRDKTGQINIRIKELARRANSHYGVLLSGLIANGETGLCHDGKAFFATDHPYSVNNPYVSGSQSNLKQWDVLTTTAPTNSEFQSATMRGIETILGLKDGTAEPINENAKKFLVMVPSHFMNIAGAALGAEAVDGSSNVIQACANLAGFEIGLAINPRLNSWTTKFAVFRADGDVTPFIRQEEEGIKVDALAEGSEHEFKEDTHLYGVSALHSVRYGAYQHGCLVSLV